MNVIAAELFLAWFMDGYFYSWILFLYPCFYLAQIVCFQQHLINCAILKYYYLCSGGLSLFERLQLASLMEGEIAMVLSFD